eukprot:3048702-Pyramimonas_sp.AAC.1
MVSTDGDLVKLCQLWDVLQQEVLVHLGGPLEDPRRGALHRLGVEELTQRLEEMLGGAHGKIVRPRGSVV